VGVRGVYQVVAEMRYALPKTYKHQKAKSKDIQVDMWKFLVPQSTTAAGDSPR